MWRYQTSSIGVAVSRGVHTTARARMPVYTKKNTSNQPLSSRRPRSVFDALDVDGNGRVAPRDILRVVEASGLRANDVRLEHAVKSLAALEGELTFQQFEQLTETNGLLLDRAIMGDLVIPDWKELVDTIGLAFEGAQRNQGGKIATYIPELAKVNPEQFAVSICSIDGQRYSRGDASVNFSLQSCAKPITYCQALEDHGEVATHKYVGREPSGRNFNELELNSENLPHNPMINSGAIMCHSLLRPHLPMQQRFDALISTWKRLSGGVAPIFNADVYHSEKDTADRNFCLAYMMREKKAFPPGTDMHAALDMYFRTCSLELSAENVAVVAATLANGGVCPTTGERVFAANSVKNCLSLMFSCGMYDYSGEFAYRIGVPGKSGVAGGMMLCIPNVMGICVWSPRLDRLGNSVRGIEFCNRLVENFNFHMFDAIHTTTGSTDPTIPRMYSSSLRTVILIQAAAAGNVHEIQKLFAQGVDLNAADYDGRTALHLAAVEGHLPVVQYLVAKGVDLSPVDRFNGTPLSDAQSNGQTEIVEFLEPLVSPQL